MKAVSERAANTQVTDDWHQLTTHKAVTPTSFHPAVLMWPASHTKAHKHLFMQLIVNEDRIGIAYLQW